MHRGNATVFVCQRCDAQYSKWTGRCLECGQWSTVVQSAPKAQDQPVFAGSGSAILTKRIEDITPSATPRTLTHIGELDRVLGGGIVPGSLILLGGDPGIGKSTLSLHIAASVPETLYFSGEESEEQIHLRAMRLSHATKNCRIAHTTNADDIIATIAATRPPLAIIDSIQTMASADIEGAAGSVTQVRATAGKLLAAAKSTNTAIILVGHVTKDGMVAGPKTLEHLVDVVLSFEGDAHHGFRQLRAVKNRFGATDELGIFDMTHEGLREVSNPSILLLENRSAPLAGSVLTSVTHGTRPLLIEIQALVTKTAFGYPVRKTSGFDANRLHLLTAVLQKWTGIALSQYDIHLNVAGGIRASDPAADIAVCLALASAFKEKPLGLDLVAFGEVGLGGELKCVRGEDRRIKECINLGIRRIIVPKIKTPRSAGPGIQIIDAGNIQELITKNT